MTIEWTNEIQDCFETLLGLEENLTFREIARRLTDQFGMPFTKNACVGRAHRMRLPQRPAHAAKPRELKGKMMSIRIDAPILPPEAQRPPNGYDLTIYQLHEGDCRYPSNGNRPPYTYCGHRTESGLSYCPAHCEIVYQTSKQR